MKNVGLYAVLMQNSIQKTSWKQYGFLTFDEQMNVIFAVMLYIMEKSLREENCTIDDIGAYIDTINTQYLKKDLSYEECRKLGDFVVNVILSNEGRTMYFAGYDFEKDHYEQIHISYVANRAVYIEQEVRRTSYYLTDDGYNLMLSTLEIENNMKLTIHEMIFQLNMERKSYDKAVDEIKNVFNLLRIQLQKIQEAMGRIRRNALNYSVKDYEKILLENLDTIHDTKEKFQKYREMVRNRVQKLEEEHINIRKLNKKEEENLSHLQTIEIYLNRAIDEHQKILNSHFDLKALYTKELESLSQMSLIQRFSFRNDLYDKVLEDPYTLQNLDFFLRPLFNREPDKIYNLNKALRYQKPSIKNEEEYLSEILDFDEETFRQEQEKRRKEKLKLYEKSIGFLMEAALQKGEVSLMEISQMLETDPEGKEKLIPKVEIFKEIMVELIRSREIDLEMLKKERSEFIQDQTEEFQLNLMLLQLTEERFAKEKISRIEIYRIEDEKVVTFEVEKTIRCSNVLIRIRKNEE